MYMYKHNLALNNLLELICHKTNQPTPMPVVYYSIVIFKLQNFFSSDDQICFPAINFVAKCATPKGLTKKDLQKDL